MTRGYNEKGEYGIISIEESINNDQNLLFCIPLPASIHKDLYSSKDFFKKLGGEVIQADIIHDGRPSKIYMKINKSTYAISAIIENEEISFTIKDEFNFGKPQISKTSFWCYLKTSFYYVIYLILKLFPTYPEFRGYPTLLMINPARGLTNEYVGKQYSEEYLNYKFVILTLNNIDTLNQLYFKHNILFT